MESVHVGRCFGDPQLGWSYGGGNLGVVRPHGYLVQRVGAFLVLRHGGRLGQ